MATTINVSFGGSQVIYGKDLISSPLNDNLLRVPGVEKLLKIASSDQSSDLSCFLIYRHSDGIDIQVFIEVLPRTQMVAVAADVRDVVFYIFKNKLGINLKRVEVYIEEM